MRILGIETSCDETAAAVVEIEKLGARSSELGFKVLSNVVASQIKIHAKTGGVVPEVAARAHVEKIIPVVEEVLKRAHPLLIPPPLRGRKGGGIDVIAVTAGPGLVTSLLVGVEVARTLAWLWHKPVVAVNHLAGHVYANWLHNPLSPPYLKGEIKRGLQFPILCLIVSGGHTELVLMRRHLDFKVTGSTRDDAAGEAFDKVAKMLGLPYPGGPAIAAQAAKFSQNRHLERPKGVERSHTMQGHEISPLASRLGRNDGLVYFPRPMINSPNFDFSFSGLKTSVLYLLRDQRKKFTPYALRPTYLHKVCYEFQEAVVDVLVAKTVRAAKQYKVETVMLGGGVAANQRLRQRLRQALQYSMPYAICSMPSVAYATDNAAMIAAAGYFMAVKKQYTPWEKIDVDPNWTLGKKPTPIPR